MMTGYICQPVKLHTINIKKENYRIYHVTISIFDNNATNKTNHVYMMSIEYNSKISLFRGKQQVKDTQNDTTHKSGRNS